MDLKKLKCKPCEGKDAAQVLTPEQARTLVAQVPVTIAHLFACPNCHQLAERKSSLRTPPIPPGKLSAPQHLRAA